MTLGEKVKLKREELNLSQEELAEKMNYKSKTSIHKIEVGITDLPLSKVKELAAVLKTTPAYLMGWEEKPNEEETTKVESPRFRWVARNAKKMTDEELGRLQKLMEVAFSEIDFDEED
ncbi:MAG: helix-turn-helix domain-containing protein [Fusobacterium polymorphum]